MKFQFEGYLESSRGSFVLPAISDRCISKFSTLESKFKRNIKIVSAKKSVKENTWAYERRSNMWIENIWKRRTVLFVIFTKQC